MKERKLRELAVGEVVWDADGDVWVRTAPGVVLIFSQTPCFEWALHDDLDAAQENNGPFWDRRPEPKARPLAEAAQAPKTATTGITRCWLCGRQRAP